MRYRTRRAPDTALRQRLRDLARERRRFGYRRLFILLRREDEPAGRNRIYRLYREEGLAVKKRRARRRATGTRAPILVEAKANARWSFDLVSDQFACGRRFRILNVIDDVTRECLASVADTSISGARVARELSQVIARLGANIPPWSRAEAAHPARAFYVRLGRSELASFVIILQQTRDITISKS